MSFVYLAIPYTSQLEDEAEARAERDARMVEFWKAAAFLIERGDHVVSPMTLEPALVAVPDMPYRWEHWKEYSIKMIGISSKLVVLQLPGWSTSRGVIGEMHAAGQAGIEIEFLTLQTVATWLSTREIEA
ncbi:hypothetical protein Ccr2_gp258 [Caulobacter phage Ccr2]|nr:hypothetical protein Ccr10_gp259 [Caulobacter phage Ccr10]ARB14134.1 hypothetical protein Ccr2_gp258 [Caulobacter phage Ccr2]ARB14476.1 hypothetical protein Ccr5_gp256 [Caulobacter phage Ccr5]ARB14828.1 hypothetical protein Ccr29_gp272 [Caulobacter phage Ccr29]